MSEQCTYTSDFIRDLLIKCTGSVMIEPDKWGFPTNIPTFDRGYFNERLKRHDAVNRKTQERLVLIFSLLFHPQKLTGKFHMPEAVNAANELICLFNLYFDVDLSVYRNNLTENNGSKRVHLLNCLETVLSFCINEKNIAL